MTFWGRSQDRNLVMFAAVSNIIVLPNCKNERAISLKEKRNKYLYYPLCSPVTLLGGGGSEIENFVILATMVTCALLGVVIYVTIFKMQFATDSTKNIQFYNFHKLTYSCKVGSNNPDQLAHYPILLI